MDSILLEKLLNEDESSSLDFKLEQYPFAGASDDEKSELIKDILAFANAWRRTDAFILIGVEEVRGGRSVVHGVTDHLGEQNLQQLVNSKTNRPIEFSYCVFPFEDKQIDIIQIPVQDRPFYLTNKYGRLNKDIVYVRRGSSTDIADVDEIARMGAANILKSQLPTLSLQFADTETWHGVGDDLRIDSLVLRLPERAQIPDAQRKVTNLFSLSFTVGSVNSNYYREFAEYFFIRYLTRPIGFILSNTGPTLLRNARLQISIPKAGGLRFFTAEQLPDTPTYDTLASIARLPVVNSLLNPETIHVGARGDKYDIWIDFGNVQPKAEALSETLYVGAEQPMRLEFEGVVYADNLSDPARIPLAINIDTQEISMSVNDLYAAINKLTEEQMRQIQEEFEDEE